MTHATRRRNADCRPDGAGWHQALNNSATIPRRERHEILPGNGMLCAQQSFRFLRAGDRAFAPWKRALDAVKADWSALSSLVLLRWVLLEGKPSFKDLFKVGADYGRL